jgi:acyl dehydratase
VISRTLIGTALPEYSIEVEKYPLRFFATAIGELNPIHHDEAAAVAAGYRSLVAPPTYVACLSSMADPAPGALLKLLGVDLARILHGEQRLVFHRPICAGDRIFFNTRVADIYDKKNGALEFVVLETLVSDQDHNKLAETQAIAVVRNAP